MPSGGRLPSQNRDATEMNGPSPAGRPDDWADPRWCGRLASASGRPEPKEPQVVDRADFDPGYDPSAPIPCEMCGGFMRYIAACKILCPNCGYKRDCSDP